MCTISLVPTSSMLTTTWQPSICHSVCTRLCAMSVARVTSLVWAPSMVTRGPWVAVGIWKPSLVRSLAIANTTVMNVDTAVSFWAVTTSGLSCPRLPSISSSIFLVVLNGQRLWRMWWNCQQQSQPHLFPW